jgi:hypothetical protein
MIFTRITVDPNEMGGLPCLRGFRILVATVVAMIADGMAEAQILAAYPDLQPRGHRGGAALCCRSGLRAQAPIGRYLRRGLRFLVGNSVSAVAADRLRRTAAMWCMRTSTAHAARCAWHPAANRPLSGREPMHRLLAFALRSRCNRSAFPLPTRCGEAANFSSGLSMPIDGCCKAPAPDLSCLASLKWSIADDL